jgi:hypothetical protein
MRSEYRCFRGVLRVEVAIRPGAAYIFLNGTLAIGNLTGPRGGPHP